LSLKPTNFFLELDEPLGFVEVSVTLTGEMFKSDVSGFVHFTKMPSAVEGYRWVAARG
jgi:hypothetical protein